MNAHVRNTETFLKPIEYATQDGWMLGTYSEKGYVDSSRLFIVCDHENFSFEKLKDAVEQINRGNVMGRGYTFEAFDEPCPGCEVSVAKGWELTNRVMKNDFLGRFVKAVDLGENQ